MNIKQLLRRQVMENLNMESQTCGIQYDKREKRKFCKKKLLFKLYFTLMNEK
jgi:hypothetical protein